MRIISWNVNGLSGLLKKQQDGDQILKGTKMTSKNILQTLVDTYNPDFLCLQEIKTTRPLDIHAFVPSLQHHRIYWNCAQIGRGYSGTLIASKRKPIGVFYNLPQDIVQQCDKEHGSTTRLNSEGRLIALYFDDFTLLNVYSPNSGFGLYRLDERTGWWERALSLFIERLQTKIRIDADGTTTKYKREVIIVGDLNVIPDLELDRKALQFQDGSTTQERDCFHALLKDRSLIDSFRFLHPDSKIWSWLPPKLWRTNVMGCRIDMVLIDKDRANKVEESKILVYQGSDHRPILADIKLTD